MPVEAHRATSDVRSSGLVLVASMTVYLAKGGWVSGDAPYVVPADVVVGLILGPTVRALHPKRAP